MEMLCLLLLQTNQYNFEDPNIRLFTFSGFLKISEVSSRFISIKQFVHAITKMGFDITGKVG